MCDIIVENCCKSRWQRSFPSKVVWSAHQNMSSNFIPLCLCTPFPIFHYPQALLPVWLTGHYSYVRCWRLTPIIRWKSPLRAFPSKKKACTTPTPRIWLKITWVDAEHLKTFKFTIRPRKWGLWAAAKRDFHRDPCLNTKGRYCQGDFMGRICSSWTNS